VIRDTADKDANPSFSKTYPVHELKLCNSKWVFLFRFGLGNQRQSQIPLLKSLISIKNAPLDHVI